MAAFPYVTILNGNRLTIQAELTLETLPQFMRLMAAFEQMLIAIETATAPHQVCTPLEETHPSGSLNK